RARPGHPRGDGPGALSPGQRAQAARHLPRRRPQRHLRRRQSGARCGPAMDRCAEAPTLRLSPTRLAATQAAPEEGRLIAAPPVRPSQAGTARLAGPTQAAAGGGPPPTSTRPPARTPTCLSTGLSPGALAGQQPSALRPFAPQLAGPPHRLRLLAHALLRGLL